jgi:hypothetical protein
VVFNVEGQRSGYPSGVSSQRTARAVAPEMPPPCKNHGAASGDAAAEPGNGGDDGGIRTATYDKPKPRPLPFAPVEDEADSTAAHRLIARGSASLSAENNRLPSRARDG